MSRAALMCCAALALALSVGAAHAGPEIPWQFHGRWCSQEHKYGTDTLIFGRQGSVADCNMEISRHALVAGGSQFTVQCEPLEIILRRDYRYQYKGKCSVFDTTAKKDLGAPSIVEGTAWITASNLLVIKSKPKPEVTLASNSTLVGDWCELKGDDLKKDDFKKGSGRFNRGECGKNELLRSVYRSRGADLNIWH
jgi:hypothetical protein